MDWLMYFYEAHTVSAVLICLGVLGIVVLAGLWIYGLGCPCTPEEKKMKLPGDELIGKGPFLRLEMAMTMNAPREKVWPYFAQLGQRRAGFYSFGFLERLFGFHIYNTFEIVDEWQKKYPGEFMFYHQNGIGTEVIDVKEGEYFTSLSDSRSPAKFQGAIGWKPPFAMKYFVWTWNFHLLDLGNGKTRFINRADCAFAPYNGWRKFLLILFLGTPSYVMTRRMMTIVRQLAEGKKKVRF